MALLVFSGLWCLIFSFTKWSVVRSYKLLMVLLSICGVIVVTVGICGYFFPIDSNALLASFFFLLFLCGMTLSHKSAIEKNVISTSFVFIALFLCILASGVMLLAEKVSDYECGCAIVTGAIMILATPYTALYDIVKKKNE